MHAPDGFLSVPVAGVMWLITIAVLAISVRKTNGRSTSGRSR